MANYEINLSEHKDRIGEYAEDGSIKQWPAKDVTGVALGTRNRTQQRLANSRYFVVVPPSFPFDVVLTSTGKSKSTASKGNSGSDD